MLKLIKKSLIQQQGNSNSGKGCCEELDLCNKILDTRMTEIKNMLAHKMSYFIHKNAVMEHKLDQMHLDMQFDCQNIMSELDYMSTALEQISIALEAL